MEEQTQAIEVGMAEMKIASPPHVLVTRGLGSCVGIVLYDPIKKIGALAHPMLPDRARGDRPRHTKYVETAIHKLLQTMAAHGSPAQDLEAKLIGGANLFSAFTSDLGQQNISTARRELERKGIKIVGESVGGSQGRSVDFALATGMVTVRLKF